ncbi:MAG: DMT family transporter [Dehalococcoidia bacterium]
MTPLAGFLQIAALAAGWGSVALIVRFVSAPSPVAVFYRVAFAALALGLALFASNRLSEVRVTVRRRAALAIGVCLAVHWLSFFAALRATSVASAVFATTSTPIFLAVLGPMLLGERPNRPAWLATLLGLTGVALMVGVGQAVDVRPAGVGLGLVAALLGAFIPIAGKTLGGSSAPTAITAVQTGVAAVVLAPVAVASGLGVSVSDLILLAILGVVHTAIAFSLYYRALRVVPVQTAGVLGLIEPLSAALLAWAVLGEAPGWSTAAGGGLILAGTLIVRPRGSSCERT